MKASLGILPFVVTALCTVAFYFRNSEENRSWRWSLALGFITLGTFTLIITEVLSATHLLHFVPTLLTWVIVSIVPLIFLWRLKASIHPLNEIARLRRKFTSIPLWITFSIIFTFLLIVVMAVATPPMNFDVQIYHLPRQIFWMMQGSVEPFSATHTHQISMPVLAEYIGLNLLVLSGTDAWHNLIQTFFMLASCGLVSLITGALGGRSRAQGLAVLTILLIPVAFFEASNAKNDIILSLFVLFPLRTGLRLWQSHNKLDLPLLLAAALSAGLAIATKGTAVVYLLPSAILITVACLRMQSSHTLLLALLPGLLLAILPSLPQILRNETLFQTPAGPNLHHANISHYPRDVVNVMIRNMAGQFTCNSQQWNIGLETSTRRALWNLNLNPDDPATTFEGQKFYLPYFAGLEDIAPSPIQTILFLLLPLTLLFRSVRQRPGIIPYFLCAFGAFLFFCLMFRWQPWQGRLLIPCYFIAAPLIGIIMDLLRPSWLPVLITMAELLALRPHLVYGGQRPLLGGSSIFKMSSEEQMSRMMPGRAAEIRQLTSELVTAPPPAIQIDGGATEIYGLLRALRVNLPKTLLISGFVDHPDTRQPWIIQSISRDAGVPLQTQESSPKAPLGYMIFWTGSYYLVFSPNR